MTELDSGILVDLLERLGMNPGSVISLTSVEQAEEFVGRNVPLYFSRLLRLSAEAAGVLAKCGYGLSFSALPVMPPSVAEALAPHKWPLQLSAIEFISRQTGDALAGHVGPLYINSRRIRRLGSERLAERLARGSENKLSTEQRRASRRMEMDVRRSLGDDIDVEEEEEEYWNEERRDEELVDPASVLWGTFSSLRWVSPEVARQLAASEHGVSLPALSCLDAEIALALVEGGRRVWLGGLASGKTRTDRVALDVLSMHTGGLFVGDEGDIQAFYSRVQHVPLLGLLVESFSDWKDKQYDSEERGSSFHEFVFRLRTLSMPEAEAMTRVTDTGRVWLYVDEGVSLECAEVCARSKGCVIFDSAELTDVVQARKLADQFAADGLWLEHLPFKTLSAEVAGILVDGLNQGQCSLSLTELATLEPEVARELGGIEDGLCFEKLVSIDPESAEALVEYAPARPCSERTLIFVALVAGLSAEVATHLCKWEGDLDLCRVPYLPEGALEVFATRSSYNVLIHARHLMGCSERIRAAVTGSDGVCVVSD